MLTVLISSAGRRNQLISCFRSSAAELGIELRVVATDVNPVQSPACRAADAAFAVPPCDSEEFGPALLEVCRANQVALLVPTIDPELAVLARQRDPFAASGTEVVISSPEVVALARDKLKTAEQFAAAGIPTPNTAALRDVISEPTQWRWPLFLKPIAGSGSAGVHGGSSLHHANAVAQERDDYIAQEHWHGREYTVHVFFDRRGRLQCSIPYLRIETRGGEVTKARTERVPVLADVAAKIATVLPGARGPLCFQAILAEDGRLAVVELNARFGGGYPLAHQAGAKMALWLLEEAAGLPSSVSDAWSENVMMLRYEEALFVGPE